MKLQIDLKSAVLGIAVGVIAMCVMAADSSSRPNGRFQIAGGSSGGDGHFAVVDTMTGQTWIARANGNQFVPLMAGFQEKKLDN